MDGSKKNCTRDTCPGFKKANKERNDDKENENEQRQQQQSQAKKRCNYDVCPSMKMNESSQDVDAAPSAETATCATYKDESGKPCCGRCPRTYQEPARGQADTSPSKYPEQARGQPMQTDLTCAQSIQTNLSQMSREVPKNSTQILFYDSTFMDAPSEYDVFFDCYSDFDIPKGGTNARQRNRCVRNAQRFDEQKTGRHCGKTQKRLMTQQSMSSNMPQLCCRSNATSQYQPCTCQEQHQQQRQQHHQHHHYTQQRQMPNSGYGDGNVGGGACLRDKRTQLDSKSMRNDRFAYYQQQPQRQQQQLQHQCSSQNYQNQHYQQQQAQQQLQQQQQQQQQHQYQQQQQQHLHYQQHQLQPSQQTSYSNYAGPMNSCFTGSYGTGQPSYSQRPAHSAQHSTNIPLGISARVATDSANLSQQITLNTNSMNAEPISFTVPLQIQLQFPIPPQYANWSGRNTTNVEPIRTATVSAATPTPNNTGKGICIDEKKSKPYIPFTTPLIQSDTYLCDCKSPLEVTEPVPVPIPIPIKPPEPEPEPEPEPVPEVKVPVPVPVLETESEPETEETVEEEQEPKLERFEELQQSTTTESDEPKPVPPPKPDAKKYRLALPQHKNLETCSPCRYDPSPLIDENGRVFCPGHCGCCLCAWRERANIELEDRLRHTKLRICKCVEKGTIFTDFNLVDPHCSKTSFFDVCPCREKAEAVFLQMYGHEMWSPDDKMSRKMTGEEVYLWECKEVKSDDDIGLDMRTVGIVDEVEIRRIDSILSGASLDELALMDEQGDDDVGKSMQ